MNDNVYTGYIRKGGNEMQFTSYLQDGSLTVVLTGEIDHHCAKGYIQAIASKLEVYTPKECILDFSQVSFMDSSGIAVAINAMRSMTKSDNLYSSNMHKNRSKSKESTAAKEGLPERYQIFEWSD